MRAILFFIKKTPFLFSEDDKHIAFFLHFLNSLLKNVSANMLYATRKNVRTKKIKVCSILFCNCSFSPIPANSDHALLIFTQVPNLHIFLFPF
jgi:hypothetical protein